MGDWGVMRGWGIGKWSGWRSGYCIFEKKYSKGEASNAVHTRLFNIKPVADVNRLTIEEVDAILILFFKHGISVDELITASQLDKRKVKD